jgi:hypothetical protein
MQSRPDGDWVRRYFPISVFRFAGRLGIRAGGCSGELLSSGPDCLKSFKRGRRSRVAGVGSRAGQSRD